MKKNIELKAIAKKIKMIALDVDGVMTDGSLTFDENGVEYKTFNCKDGLGVVMLKRSGVVPAIITARNNGTVVHRAKILGITELYQGQKNKLEALNELLEKYNVTYEEVAYMGDDLPDLIVMEKVGLPACPADAVEEILDVAKFVSTKGGGKGAVREFANFILKSKGINIKQQGRVPACST